MHTGPRPDQVGEVSPFMLIGDKLGVPSWYEAFMRIHETLQHAICLTPCH